MTRTESQVEWAKSELERNGTLFRGELIAARDVDNARNRYNIAVARPDGRRQRPPAISIPTRCASAEAQLDSDRAALRVAEAEVARREAIARHRAEAARRHDDPRALRGRDRQAPRERRAST